MVGPYIKPDQCDPAYHEAHSQHAAEIDKELAPEAAPLGGFIDFLGHYILSQMNKTTATSIVVCLVDNCKGTTFSVSSRYFAMPMSDHIGHRPCESP